MLISLYRDSSEDVMSQTGIGSHKLAEMQRIKNFILAGNAIFTIRNNKTGNRFTYKFSKPKNRKHDSDAPIFVSLMNGTDNERSYAFMGTIFPNAQLVYRHSQKSTIASICQTNQTIEWLVK